MNTNTFLEAISEIKTPGVEAKFQRVLKVYGIYLERFSMISVLAIFEDLPPEIEWGKDEQKRDVFFYGGVRFRPTNLDEFISVAKSIGINLSPRPYYHDGKFSTYLKKR